MAERNKRIRIESPGTTRDAIGGVVPGWSHFATVWASVREPSGREYIAAGAEQAAAVTEFGVDYLPGLTAKMRVLLDGTEFGIEAILGQDHVSQTLVCRRMT